MESQSIEQLLQIAKNAMEEVSKAQKALAQMERQKEQTKRNNKKRYETDEAFRQYHIRKATERYYKNKQEKMAVS